MNKKLSFIALSALMLTACSNDDLLPVAGMGEPTEVTFTVGIPDGLQTRAENTTVGKGYSVERLYVTAISKADATKRVTKKIDDAFAGNATTANVTLNLVKGDTYNLVFWADCGDNNYYTYDPATANVTVQYKTLLANDEKLDAFSKYVPSFTAGDVAPEPVKLNRPLAQVNIANTLEDATAAEALGVTVTRTALKLAYDAYPTLNLISGEMSGTPKTYTVDAPMTFTSTPKPTGELIVNGTAYNYLAYTYVLAGTNGNVLTNVNFKFDDNTGNRDYSNIPVKRNYRTNIIGQILTNPYDFTVVLDEAFEDDYNQPVTVVLPAGKSLADFVTEDNQPAVAAIEPYSPTRATGSVFFAGTFQQALAKASEYTDGAVIYFHPDAVLTGNAHMGSTLPNLVIYANGAEFKTDLAVDTYDNQTGNKTNSIISSDQNIEIYDAKNLYVWGQVHGNYTRNIKMVNCHNEGTSAVASAGRMIYLTGTVGKTNITLLNCSVKKSDSPVYSNASGNISLINCYFEDCAVPVNINFKDPTGVQNDLVESCRFVRCGATSSMDAGLAKYAAPMRFVKAADKSENKDFSQSTLNLTVRNTVCEGTLGDNGDLLTSEKRETYDWWPINIINVDSNIKILPLTDASGATILSTPSDVVYMLEQIQTKGGTYTLACDIDMTGVTIPEGRNAKSFVFNGNEHTIKNVNINGYSQAALFGRSVSTCVINDLTIADSSFIGNGGYIDGKEDVESAAGAFFAFYDFSSPTLNNCKIVNVTVGGAKYVGGMIGYTSGTFTADGCVAENCTIQSAFTKDGKIYQGHAGAITGYFTKGVIKNSGVKNCTFDVLGARGGIFVGTCQNGATFGTGNWVQGNKGLTNYIGAVDNRTDKTTDIEVR